MTGHTTGLLYAAFDAAPAGAAADLGRAVGAEFEPVDADSELQRVSYRAHDAGLTYEVENVASWQEGTVYRLVVFDEAGTRGLAVLDEHLRTLARVAGTRRMWSLPEFKAAYAERER